MIKDMCLADKTCVPCKGGVPPMDSKDAHDFMKQLESGWAMNKEGRLHKSFAFKDFMGAMDFAQKIAQVAEDQGHHPDLGISWGACDVELWTHKIGGLSESDFILAAKIDRL